MENLFEIFDQEESKRRLALVRDINQRYGSQAAKVDRKTAIKLLIEDSLASVLGLESRINQQERKAKEEGIRFYLRNYMDDLVDYAFSGILENPSQLEDYRDGVFKRIKWEFEYLDKRSYVNNHKKKLVINELIEYEQWRSYKGFGALDELFNLIISDQIVSKRNAQKLRKMFDDEEMYKVIVVKEKKAQIPRKRKVDPFKKAGKIATILPVQSLEEPKQHYDQGVEELLVECFDIPQEIAKRYARITTEDKAIELYSNLVELVGDEKAEAIIKDNPEIITYNNNGEWNKYQKAIRYLLRTQGEEYIDSLEIRSYSSLEAITTLKQDIPYDEDDQETEEETERINYDQINVGIYSFLNIKVQPIALRLKSLMENGEVSVGIKDHWTEQNTNVRANFILIKIKRQIKKLYDQLGLNKPSCRMNFPERSMTIDDTARENLCEIYKQLYQV